MIGVVALACIGAIVVAALIVAAFTCGCLCLAKLVSNARNNVERERPELCGFFIVPEAINSIHDGDK